MSLHACSSVPAARSWLVERSVALRPSEEGESRYGDSRSGRGSWIVIRVVGVGGSAQKERPIVMFDMTGCGEPSPDLGVRSRERGRRDLIAPHEC